MSDQFDLLELVARGGLPHERAIAAIEAFTDHAFDDAERWTLPTCDARLLELYRDRYGPELRAVSACPECGTLVELQFAVDDLLAALSGSDRESLTVEVDGYELKLRLPTVGDLARARHAQDLEHAREVITTSCVSACTHKGVAITATSLPASLIDQVEESLKRFDLGGEGIELTCPDCSTVWTATLDVTALVLAELDAEGERLLADVHLLARAYGWSESEIVALSPGRRRRYVEMVAR
jgi:hypothetical protein